ncbi:alcohol dehydrogenase catalytic domain-containing protein [Brevibacillus fortis]|uniref:alcohol dehydrogenase catalytic domain-containing protein n=1 Tax=Brevibacillus fortis TaxID=2126352 RepID=UPI0038FD1E1A
MRGIGIKQYGGIQQLTEIELPLILGLDAASTVTAVGTNVQDFQIGDDVFFRPELEREGTYTDEIVVPANIVALMPRGLSYAEAASLPLVGLTVWQALVEVGKVQAGAKVLMLGESGGPGFDFSTEPAAVFMKKPA